MLSMTRSTFFGAIAAWTFLRRSGSLGSRTTSAPNALSFADFSALRDNATTVRPIDWPSNTDATPTPPDAPVTSRTERSGGGAGGSFHWVRACQAVRKTNGAPAICSAVHPVGMGTRLSSGTTHLLGQRSPGVRADMAGQNSSGIADAHVRHTRVDFPHNTTRVPSQDVRQRGLGGVLCLSKEGVRRVQRSEAHRREGPRPGSAEDRRPHPGRSLSIPS